MSVSFYGKSADGAAIMLDIEDPSYLNWNAGNAHALFLLLGLSPGEDQYGECTMPEARRGVMLARATFEKRAVKSTREPSDTRRPGQARFIQGGLDEDGLLIRLDAFERFLNVIAAKGAVSIYWA